MVVSPNDRIGLGSQLPCAANRQASQGARTERGSGGPKEAGLNRGSSRQRVTWGQKILTGALRGVQSKAKVPLSNPYH